MLVAGIITPPTQLQDFAASATVMLCHTFGYHIHVTQTTSLCDPRISYLLRFCTSYTSASGTSCRYWLAISYYYLLCACDPYNPCSRCASHKKVRCIRLLISTNYFLIAPLITIIVCVCFLTNNLKFGYGMSEFHRFNGLYQHICCYKPFYIYVCGTIIMYLFTVYTILWVNLPLVS